MAAHAATLASCAATLTDELVETLRAMGATVEVAQVRTAVSKATMQAVPPGHRAAPVVATPRKRRQKLNAYESRPNPNPWLNSAGVGLGERPSFNVAILAERRKWAPRPPNPGPNAVRNFMHRLSYDLEMRKQKRPPPVLPKASPRRPFLPTSKTRWYDDEGYPVPQAPAASSANRFAAAPFWHPTANAYGRTRSRSSRSRRHRAHARRATALRRRRRRQTCPTRITR